MANDPDEVDHENLRKLEKIAIDKALETKEIGDIEKSVSISKTITDRNKTARDYRNQRVVLRFEWYKTFASAIVPLLTLLTLGFTVWIQIKQLNETNIANADAGWRDTAQKVLSQLRPSGTTGRTAGMVDGQLTIQLLRPYFSDPRHGTEAMDIGMLVVTRTGDRNAIENFYAFPDIKVTDSNVNVFLFRARDLESQLAALDDESQLQTLPVEIARNADKFREALSYNLRLICGKISESLQPVPRINFPDHVDGIHFLDCSFANVNLRGAIIKKSHFERVDFRGADLSNVRAFEQSAWEGSNWWDAKRINGPLLFYLLKNYFPYADGSRSYFQQPPIEAAYKNKVRALCGTARVDCPDKLLRFGPQLDSRLKPILSNLSPDDLIFVAKNDLSPGRYHGITGDDGKEELIVAKELVAAHLCDEAPDLDVRAHEKAHNDPPGSWLSEVSCNDDYTEIRRYLLTAIVPEYLSRLAPGVGTSEEAGADKPIQIKAALSSFSSNGLAVLLSNTASTSWPKTAAPTIEERKGVGELAAAGVCSIDSPSEMRQNEVDAGIQANTIVFAMTCSSLFNDVAKVVKELVIPQLIKDAKST
ncbi:pentapeptide repeat-containing protein [Caballeronia sp. DA-9]|uniref:pentapeptide repeat-containing protein n=1 Tax=Caballeronia sp. DA-9 TaxID=3436237 RepID=UPI003F66AFA9